MEGNGEARYIGTASGETFLDACKNYIKETGCGEIDVDSDGNEYANDWAAAGTQHLQRHSVRSAEMEVLS